MPLVHGAAVLAGVEVDSYNVEITDAAGFVGDKANKGAFREILERLRKAVRESGEEDPLGERDSHEIGKKKLETLLAKGDAPAAAVVQSAIEDFAQQLADVIRRFMRLEAWRNTQTIVVGGGFRAGRIGELAIARTAILLQTEIRELSVRPIHNDPDEAGLLGAAYLVPRWMLDGYDAVTAVDIGGTNLRAGLVELNLAEGAKGLSTARVCASKLWRHADEKGVTRDSAVRGLGEMIGSLVRKASKRELRLAPLLVIGCPGVIANDGTIIRGGHNLPGDWEGSAFNLPSAILREVPRIGGSDPVVVMHNDAVAQGLSELPYLGDVSRWGILTVGTGLGNARFSKRAGG